MHTLLTRTLHLLITREGINAPNILNFRVCKQWLPLQMFARAHALVVEQERCILKGLRPLNGEEPACYYVLSLSQTAHPQISHDLVGRCVCMPRAYTCTHVHALVMGACHVGWVHVACPCATCPCPCPCPCTYVHGHLLCPCPMSMPHVHVQVHLPIPLPHACACQV